MNAGGRSPETSSQTNDMNNNNNNSVVLTVDADFYSLADCRGHAVGGNA